MTIDDVKRRVSEIESKRLDDEAAHGLEDDLFADVLRAIAYGECNDPSGLAESALCSLAISFDRWCA